jgi:O-methyltransferase domain
MLKKYPQLKGVLFDLPHVVQGSKRHIEQEGLAERCQVVAGNFFESVPRGGDAYTLKWIIHDWDEERSIAQCCSSSKAPSETTVVVQPSRLHRRRPEACTTIFMLDDTVPGGMGNSRETSP